MATYNGATFIAQQIESIQKQTHKEWSLIIRDDGSSDETIEIIKSYAKKDPRIHLLDSDKKNLGPKNNFSELTEYAFRKGYDYYFYTDQDDIWEPNKITAFLNRIDSESNLDGSQTAILVYSDLSAINESGDTINPSLSEYKGIHHVTSDPIKTLLIHNFITGCSMACNHALLATALPIPDEAIMHDWWLALCAATYGTIVHIPTPLTRYRLHGENSIGARKHTRIPQTGIKNFTQRWKEGLGFLDRKLNQDLALWHRIKSQPPRHSHTQENISQFLNIFQTRSPLSRLIRIKKSGINVQRGWMYMLLAMSHMVFSKKHVKITKKK